MNVSKTKFILFKSKNKCEDYKISLWFRNNEIQRVPLFNFLGVLFNEHLSWTPQINKIHANMSTSISVLYKLGSLVPKWLKLQLYYSLAHSYLHYCLLIWGTTSKTNLDRLLVLQKRAVRFIENLQPREHTPPFFGKLQILTVYQLYNLKLTLYISTEIGNNIGSYMEHCYPSESPYDLRFARFRLPLFRTVYGNQTLSYQIPHLIHNNSYIRELLEHGNAKNSLKKKVKVYFLSCTVP